MAKAYTFSASGGLVPVDALEAATSINIASSAFVANSSGITMGSDKDITLSGGGEILGLPSTPSDATAAASMAYVQSYADSVASGLDVKKSVHLATAEALAACTYANGTSGVGATLTSDANDFLFVDGIAVEVGDRVLVKDQAASFENGIYVVTGGGSSLTAFVLTRASDADTGGVSGELTPGAFTFVEAGNVNADTGWVVSSPDSAINIGTTAISWTQFSSAGIISAGAGLIKTGNTIDVVSGNSAIVVNANDITLFLGPMSGLEITSGLKIDLDVNPGLALGADGLKVDVNALSDAATEFSAASVGIDYFPFYDAANSATKRVSFAQLASVMAGTGISASNGIFAAALSELDSKGSPDSLDLIVIVDGTDSDSKKASMTSIASVLASLLDGSGLGVMAGELVVNVDNSTIEIDSDSLRLKDGGITAGKLGTGSVTAVKMELVNSVSSLVSAAAVTAPECKAVYLVAASGKVNLSENSQAGAHVQGLFANSSDIAGADENVDLYTVDGSFLTIPSAARAAASFTKGAIVYAIASGILTTDFSGQSSGDWLCPVGTSVDTNKLILRIGSPFQKA